MTDDATTSLVFELVDLPSVEETVYSVSVSLRADDD
jgi:hypothetical protein